MGNFVYRLKLLNTIKVRQLSVSLNQFLQILASWFALISHWESIVLTKERTSCPSPLPCYHSNNSSLAVLTWLLPLHFRPQDICLSALWASDICLGFSLSFVWISLLYAQLSQAALEAFVFLLWWWNHKVLHSQRFAVHFMAGTSRAVCLSSLSLINMGVGVKPKAEQTLKTLKCISFLWDKRNKVICQIKWL